MMETTRSIWDKYLRLRGQKLYAKIEKCEFFVLKLTFLGYVALAKGIQVDQSKIEVVQT